MRPLLHFYPLILFPLLSFGQGTFQRSYDLGATESACTVVQTFDKGYAICGIKSGGSNPYAFLLRTNEAGDTLWSKIFPDYLIFGERIMQETSDSGFIICGNDDSVFLIKTDKNGDIRWTSHLPGKSVTAVIQTADRGFILSVNGTTTGLVKTDVLGNLLWQKSYRISGSDYSGAAKSILQTHDRGYVLTGTCDPLTNPELYEISAFLLKTSENGDSIWLKKYHSDNTLIKGFSVCQTADEGYEITGQTEVIHYNATIRGYLIRTDVNGDTLWTRRTALYRTWLQASAIAYDHNIVSCGFMDSPLPGGGLSIVLNKEDLNGEFLFSRAFPVGYYGNSVSATSDHGFIIAGEKDGNIILIKTDSSGRADPAGMSENRESNCLLLFPNPTKGVFRINLSGNVKSIEITDVSGRTVYRRPFVKSPPAFLDIDLSKKAKGTYLVSLKTKNGTQSGKLVVE